MNSNIKSIFSSAEREIKNQINRNVDTKKSFSYEKDKILESRILFESVLKTQDSIKDLSLETSSVQVGDSAIDVMRDMDVRATFRSLFGKTSALISDIGCHPDFLHLKDSEYLENGYSITMFMDIAGSTKLGRLYSPDIVFNIKNTIIKYAIKIIQAFDGHVHRIMGDAVMAFFRSKEKEQLKRQMDNAIDSLNCGVYLIEFMENVITPILSELGAEDPIGIRIGIDYGAHEDIVWGNYGAHNAFEVTATSYYVDVAAKLQQVAKTNKIMIGENFKKLIGFGDEYVSRLEKISNGETQKICYVKPNYNINGKKINYNQYELKNKILFKYLPFGIYLNTSIEVRLFAKNKIDNTIFEYKNCSQALDKHLELSFKVKYTNKTVPAKKLHIKSRKQNTGPESESQNANIPITKIQQMDYYNYSYHGEITESTLYKGLHHMYIDICDEDNRIIESTCFSLYIR
ncbi:adenylate/guanylate cyclase domain-containing protein [Proteus cibi]|uniref:nucleotide-binding domain-containing protein n=1 Tax=Proteus cibi TaxID=2050966 RepID=UPI0032DB32A9